MNGLDLFSEEIMRGWPGSTGKNHPCWKGGTLIDRDGYVQTWAPSHPWPRKGYLREHIRIMELQIGRRILPDECVHHVDHDRQNNRLENLRLMKRAEHSKQHRGKDAHSFPRDAAGKWRGYI